MDEKVTIIDTKLVDGVYVPASRPKQFLVKRQTPPRPPVQVQQPNYSPQLVDSPLDMLLGGMSAILGQAAQVRKRWRI